MNKNLILLALSMFIWGIGEGMFIFLQPLYLQELGADPIAIGTILSGFSMVMAIAHLPAGYLADKIGRRPLIWLSWGLGILATGVMALAMSLNGFVIGLLLYGLTFFVMSPLNSYASAARGKLTVGQAIMLLSSVFNLGMVIGPWLGGSLGEAYGLRSIFFVAFGVFILAGIVVLFIAPQPVEARHPSHPSLSILKNKQLLIYSGIVLFTVVALYLPQPLSQNYLHNELGLSIQAIGRLASVAGLGVAGVSFLASRLEPRLGIILGQLAVGGFAYILWRGSGIAWLAMGYFLLGGYKTARALISAQTSQLVHNSNLGFVFGVTETVGSIAMILASLLAGVLYQSAATRVYMVSLALIALSILISWRYLPAPQSSHVISLEPSTPVGKD